MTLIELHKLLNSKFGDRAVPDTWWPIFYGRTEPKAFERVITNVLVTQSNWLRVRGAVDALNHNNLLTAKGLADADEQLIATCVKPVGFQVSKARCLKGLGSFVQNHFGTEVAFCSGVTRDQLLSISGVGPETADRILLYTCGRLAWPVDTYCYRVLAYHGIISAVPEKQSEKKRLSVEIKKMVETELPRQVEDWQRLHAVMQLEGEDMRKRVKVTTGG